MSGTFNDSEYVNVGFSGGARVVTANSVYQYDHGLKLRVNGQRDGSTQPVVQFEYPGLENSFSVMPEYEGTSLVCSIPDIVQTQPKEVRAYIYVEVRDSGSTVYEVRIPVLPRARPQSIEFTPQQNDAFNSALQRLNSFIDEANEQRDQLESASTLIDDAKQSTQEAVDALERFQRSLSGQAEKAQAAADAANQAKQSAETATKEAKDAAQAAKDIMPGLNEAKDAATDAAQEARQAAADIADAEQKAETAAKSATEAATKADEAVEKAESAATQAEGVIEEAGAAASQANSAAEEARQAAQRADSVAEQVEGAVTEAKEAAKTITEANEAAQQAAQSATEAAGQATSSAGEADAAATKANDAATKADAAADAAQEKADYIGNITVEAHDVDARESATATKSDVDGHLHISFGLRRGEKGEPGAPNIVKGKAYASLEALQAGVPEPAEGDQYNVGEEPPYNVYRYTGEEWEDQGKTQGPQGADGESAGFGAADATVAQDGEPGCTVTTDGPASATNFHFAFTGLRGEKGTDGAAGADGIGIGDIMVTMDNENSESPTCTVTPSVTETDKDFTLAFSGLKGKDGTNGVSIGDITVTVGSENSENPTCVVTPGEEAEGKQPFTLAFNGIKGKDGNGISGAEITEEFKLKLTYGDGSDWTSEESLQGPEGKGYIVKGDVYGSQDELKEAVTSPQEGDRYEAGTEPPYHIYRWTGEKWIDEGTSFQADAVTTEEITQALNEWV